MLGSRNQTDLPQIRNLSIFTRNPQSKVGLAISTRSGSGIFEQCLPGKRDHVVHWFAGVLDAPEAAGVLLPQVLDQKLLEGERWKEKPIHT